MAVQESRLIISIDARNAERTAKALNSELQGITNNGAKADNQINAMSGSLKALAGYMGGILTISSAISMADGYTQMAARIRNATSSAQEYELVQERILATANTTFRSLGEAQEVYLSMAGGMKSLGYQTTQTLDLVDSLSFSFTHNATRADQAQSAMDSLSKSMAKGKIDADAWISIVTGADNVIADMAKTTGKTEAEIRKLGAEGKASLEDLIKTLIATRDENERLANNMENSLADGFTKLSNEVTVYLGKANEATSATGLMAGALTVLADNLDLVANAALVGGIGYVTKAILAKTVAVQGAIAASMAQRAANAAEAQSSIAVATAKVNEAKAHLANVQATNAETQAKYGAAAANARYNLASDAVTKALIAQTAAQGALNSSVTLGSRALALVGGPIGAITLGVSALAAGYMYLKNRTAEANAKLEEQAKVANKTKEELLALEGAQRKSAQVDLATAFAAQNKELNALNQQFNAAVISVQNYAVKNQVSYESLAKIREISNKVRQGLISQEEAIKQINNLYFVTPDQIKQIKNLNDEYEIQRGKTQNTADAQSVYGTKVTLAGNAASNAAAKVRDKAGAMGDDAAATRDAASANREYTQSLQQRLFDQTFITELVTKHNKTQQEANLLLEAYKKTNGQVSAQDKEIIAAITAQQKALENYGRTQTAVSKARTSAAKSQARENKAATKDAESHAREMQRIVEEYSTDDDRRRIELEQEIARLREYGMTEYIALAQNRFNEEAKLIKMKFEYDLIEFELSEEKKLRFKTNIREQEIKADAKLTQEQQKLKLDALKIEFGYELAQIQLAKETRMFQMKEAFLSETDVMNQRYALEEKRIMQIRDIEEREFALKMNRLKQEEEQRKRIQDAQIKMGGIQAQNSGTSDFVNIETTRFDQIAVSEELFQAQLAANFEAREQLWREHEDRVTEINRAADAARLNLQLSYGQQITGSFADMFKNIAGEQSNGYKLMFTAQKAFAIAQSAIAIQQGIAQAFSLPFPLNLAAAATVAAQTASIVANIKSIRAEGFKSGGYTGNGGVNDIAGVVHGQEYVLNAEATKRVGRGTLDALNNGGTLESGSGVNVIINVPQGYKAVQTQSENGVTIDIVENMINQAFDNVRRPNSNESRAIQGAFGIAPKR